MLLLTAAEMREYDRTTIEDVGIPGVVLMELAGRGCAEICQKVIKARGIPTDEARVAVVCGAGNNGGDGYVVARHLQNAGARVTTYLLAPPEKLKGDALINYRILEKTGGHIVDASAPGALPALLPTLKEAHLLVDAILGTGLTRDVREDLAESLRLLDTLPCPRVAVDIPSGVDSDTGAIRGAAIRANHTVTFGLMKRGHWLYPGRALSGEVHLVDISIPTQLIARTGGGCQLLTAQTVKGLLPRRGPTSYKNTFGHLLLCAGSPGKGGAALLSATSALRSGAGLVTLATSSACQKSLEGRALEVMVEPAGPEGGAFLDEYAFSTILALSQGKQAFALGPGLGQTPETFALARRLVQEIPLPAVVDADGLNAIAQDLSCLKETKGPRILTPHPGEMGRLLGVSTAEVAQNRVEVAQRFAREHQLVLVLKGADTLVAGPAGELFINSSGNPGLATAGSGDVLTGIIGAFLAQGLSPLDAARLGVYLHGAAADYARTSRGETAMIASDVTEALPAVLKGWERE